MVSDGDNITGNLTCAPNAKNNRDLDITIEYANPEDEQGNIVKVDYKMCVPPADRTFTVTDCA
jgi:protein arginine N-methyltransferase 1